MLMFIEIGGKEEMPFVVMPRATSKDLSCCNRYDALRFRCEEVVRTLGWLLLLPHLLLTLCSVPLSFFPSTPLHCNAPSLSLGNYCVYSLACSTRFSWLNQDSLIYCHG